MKQGVFALIGLFVMLIFMSIPYIYWKKAAPILLLISFCALILVLFGGTNINGARRWFVLSGFNLQPSEFTKLTVIVYISALVSRKRDQIRNFKRGFLYSSY